jgi:hypothetical protein
MIGHFSGPLRPALSSVGMGLRTRLGQEGNANLQELRFYCDDTSLPAFSLRMSRNARSSSPVLPVSEASVSGFEETAQEWTPISPHAHYLDRASINEHAQVWKEAFECHCQTVPVWEEFGELVDYIEKIRTGFRDMKLLLRNLNLNYAHGWGEAADSGRNNFDGSFDVPYLPELAQDIAYAQFRLLDRILYIGPQRNLPGRISIYSGLPTEDVGQSGEHLPDVLFSQHESMRKINEALRRLAIGYKIDIDQLTGRTSGASDVFSIQLVSDVNSLKVRLNDVGYGVSQVLPVVVQSLLAASRDLLIEQPELHLHPRLQAELADVFVRSAFEQKNTLLLETHSEHLILRLMRRIRETSRGTLPEGMPTVKPEDVSIIYVQPTENGSVPLVMDLDEDGELLTAWPNGFFEEGFRERFA